MLVQSLFFTSSNNPPLLVPFGIHIHIVPAFCAGASSVGPTASDGHESRRWREGASTRRDAEICPCETRTTRGCGGPTRAAAG